MLSPNKLKKLLESTDEIELFSLKNKQFLAKVITVYDGDTCKVNIFLNDNELSKFTVRLFGYDSPEIKTKDPIEKKFAELSKSCLEKMILDKVVNLNCYEFDKYGRVLAKITSKTIVGDIFIINDFMVKNHLGYPYKGDTKNSFQELYKNNYYREEEIDIPTTIHYQTI